MSDKEQGYQLPRPWYISLTAVWKEAKNFPDLLKLVTRTNASRPAGNHVHMPQGCWHFTVLAIMKLSGCPGGTPNMREFAGRVFEPIRRDNAIVKALQKGFKGFAAEVYEVRCTDKGMTLQFECKEPLEDFRNHARRVLGAPVSALVGLHTNSETGRRFREAWGVPLVESILDDPKKNYGTQAFGSIARSPCRSECDIERWREPLERVALKFDRIHLLVSDEMLTNPRCPAEDVRIVRPAGSA